jgi:guanylate kinase
MDPRFLLLLGVSGVGKSTIIRELKQLDPRFVYISPFITRPLRDGETDKISITDAEMNDMDERGAFLVINPLYGVRYGTPRDPILSSLATGKFPVLDWPISKLKIMRDSFPRLYLVYLLPPSLAELQQRLGYDGRDHDSSRFTNAVQELDQFRRGEFEGIYDICVVSKTGNASKIARQIYDHYTLSLLS